MTYGQQYPYDETAKKVFTETVPNSGKLPQFENSDASTKPGTAQDPISVPNPMFPS